MLQNYFRLDGGYRYRREAHAAYLIHKVLNLSQIDSSLLESIDFVVVGREDKLELPQLQVCYVLPEVEGN